MRKIFATLILASLTLPLHAQRGTTSGSQPPPRPIPAAEEKEEKPEKPKAAKPTESRSFLSRVFGPRATPTPAPTPLPVKPKPKPKAKPATETPEEAPEKAKPAAKPAKITKPTDDEAATTKPAAKPAKIAKPTEDEAATTKPAVPAEPANPPTKAKGGKNAPKKIASTGGDTSLDDATKFKSAKAKALEDAHIKELKSKADGELNETDAAKAQSSYSRALFQKIREIDPSVGDYATKVEQALTKRVSAEKGK